MTVLVYVGTVCSSVGTVRIATKIGLMIGLL